VRWKKDFVQEFGSPLPAFGFVCSPLVIGDHVYVQAGGGFLKVEKRTGRVLWRTLEDGGGMNGSAFSSPVLAELSGIPQFVVQTRTHLTGVDFNTGKVLWKQEVPAFRGMNIVTPVVHQGNIFTSSYGGATFLYRPEFKPAGWEVTKVWENRVQGYMSTPVVIDGHVYLHMKNQRFTCINLATGEQTWTSTPYGKYWSMVASGNRILALDERGDLLLLNANPEKFELVESRHLTDDPAWAHLAVSGNQLVIRSLEKLTVLSSK
jgi:outer membrane protein assembly factor BamB